MNRKGRLTARRPRTNRRGRVADFSWIIRSALLHRSDACIRAEIALPGRPGIKIVPPLGNVLQVDGTSSRPSEYQREIKDGALSLEQLFNSQANDHAVLLDAGRTDKNGDKDGPENTKLLHRRPRRQRS